MGWSLSSLIPKNTIVGKALSGDLKGAASSAVNYVKSGELATDLKNISTQNVAAIAQKAVGGYQGNGNLLASATKSVLDKGANITSLKPTPTQASNAQSAQASAQIALAVGSGVPIAKASAMQTSAPMSSMAQDTPPPAADSSGASGGTSTSENTIYWVLGGAAALLLLSKKKTRSYVRRGARRTYARTRSYARRTYGRAMSYRRRK